MTTIPTDNALVNDYKYGFVSDIQADTIDKGLTENTIRQLSEKKNEPDFMLEFRLKAFRHWQTLKEPHWCHCDYEPVDYQDLYYYSAPKQKEDGPESLEEVDDELLATFDKLGI